MKEGITIVGLGPGSYEQLSLGAWEKIRSADKLLLQTARHPIANWLNRRGINYKDYDDYFLMASNFKQVYELIAKSVIEESSKGPLVFAVPGNPLVAEPVVELIREKSREEGNIPINIVPGMSFIDNLYTILGADIVNTCEIVDGMSLGDWEPEPGKGYIVHHIFDRYIATEVKLELMEYFPAEHHITVIRAAGIPIDEKIKELPLTKLGSIDWIDHFTSVYLPPCDELKNVTEKSSLYPLDPLVNVMAELRGESGCPWDLEQDHNTLVPYLLEETYEVIDALKQGEMYKFCEELGDLLLQIVFHAQIASENERFGINQVIESITEKMIRRHPHVFEDVTVENSSQVLENWEKIKQEEKDGGEQVKSILKDIPGGLPALLKASKVQKKVSRVGFDWPDYNGALKKVEEEQEELVKASNEGDIKLIEEEIGDLMFAIVNLARFYDIEPEAALNYTVNKFIRRFNYIEENVKSDGRSLEGCNLKELDAYWERAKNEENLG